MRMVAEPGDAATPIDVAAAWSRYHVRSQTGAAVGDQDPDWWAVDFWTNGGWSDENLLRQGLLALVDTVPDDLLSYVGAGPLEGFVRADESRIEWIEVQAGRSERFRRALANVWTWGNEPDDVAARLERAAGIRLPRPKDWTESEAN